MKLKICLIVLGVAALIAAVVVNVEVPHPVSAANCNGASLGFLPLNDQGVGYYQGAQGGLYPNGLNARPTAHESAGVTIGESIQPLNNTGVASSDGKIVMVAIGMSNTRQEFDAFMPLANGDPQKNPQLLLINAAQSGHTAQMISAPTHQYWDNVDKKLAQNGVAPAQVQIGWLKQARGLPSEPFPEYAELLQENLESIVRIMKDRFPNIKIIYLSSRIYAGYATVDLNPEPYAYESGFSVKWLIEGQINGDPALNYNPANGAVVAPWLSWGPYLWADGLNPRSDGLIWECADFEAKDGTHPTEKGQEKVAQLMLAFFKSDSTAVPWFTSSINNPDNTPTPTARPDDPTPTATPSLNKREFLPLIIHDN